MGERAPEEALSPLTAGARVVVGVNRVVCAVAGVETLYGLASNEFVPALVGAAVTAGSLVLDKLMVTGSIRTPNAEAEARAGE